MQSPLLLSFAYLILLGGPNSSGRGGRNSQSSTRGNKRPVGRDQGIANNTRGGGSRPALAQHVPRPVQRGGITSNQSTRSEGRGFTPSSQAWQPSGGNNTSFPTGTVECERCN